MKCPSLGERKGGYLRRLCLGTIAALAVELVSAPDPTSGEGQNPD